MDLIKVDDVTIMKSDIEMMREQVIAWRNESFKFWPDSIGDTLTTTYIIGFLAGVLTQYPDFENVDEFLAQQKGE